MMEVYNTYKEAVLANGSTDGVHENLRGGEFQFGFLEPGRWKICNPSDYLESLKSFLASGKRLVNGDRYVEDDGEVMLVSRHGSDDSVPEDSANGPMKHDDRRFILQAAADQVETPEEKEAFDAIDTTPLQVELLGKAEWNNGDSVVFGKDDRSGIYIAYDAYNEGHVVYSGGDYFYVLDGGLSKPETPAEREQRERLEAAYDLYATGFAACNRGKVLDFDTFRRGFANFYLAIVDKTGYRKQ